MYARLIRKKETSLLRLYGRRVSDGKVVPIVDDNVIMYVPPVNELRMKNILDFTWSRGGEPATKQVLHDYLRAIAFACSALVRVARSDLIV
jgi:hypothetical protein